MPTWSGPSRATRRPRYEGQGASPDIAAIAADEREHAVIWDRLKLGEDVDFDGGSGRDGVAIATKAKSAAEIGRREGWHRAGGRSGTLRAVIFGVSDGLVSNLSLVMGVAGAASSNPSFILLAGVAGLLAGAFSMAAGEYISMQSQRELFEHQISLERAEMEAMPEEEEAELAAAYRAKGFAPDEAARIAHRIFEDPEPRWTRSSARNWASIPTSSARRSRRQAARSWRSRSAPASRSSRISSVAAGRPRRQPRSEPGCALRGRGGGQPPDRARRDLLGRPPARDRPCRRARDLRDRHGHRGRLGGLIARRGSRTARSWHPRVGYGSLSTLRRLVASTASGDVKPI